MDQGCISIVSGAPAGPMVQVCFPGVRAAVLDSLNRQREEGRLCDLSIQVQGQVFRAHRCVLAASSPYFHDQVLLKNVTTVSLPSVMDPVAFESVLSSAYTGQLSIVRDDIVNYVTVASFLQMWHIVDKCTEILKRPRPPAECNPGDAAAATHHGASSRQQSPSSTDCLYMEREGKGKERRPYGQEQNSLPPLATWRRPQQFPSSGELQKKEERPLGRSLAQTSPHVVDPDDVIPGPSCPAPTPSSRMQWQAGPWSQQVARPPLVPDSPDDNDFNLGAQELNWPSGADMTHGGGTPTSSCHLSPSPAPFPPSSSPPIPSSSSLSLAGAPYTGKVHFCHCGKAYTLKSMRDRHVKMQHLNLRPFACPVCTKSFKMKHHLTKHLKTHGGLRPYECGLCGKKVIWRDSFLRHQARCERLAASCDGAAASSNTRAAADMDNGYAYGFGEGFLSHGGQVKVEQADFQGEAESGMSGLLGAGAELGSQSRTLVSHNFKEEASDRFS
uniref:Zinc finger and BTB domain containing 22a n=1 Tax=Oncorhynchus tshawytscha TaxID=74940 RepID=A0A8C8D6X0_ONCTS